jgi:hypothetical protein
MYSMCILREYKVDHQIYATIRWNGWCCHDGQPAAATCVQLNGFYNLAAVGTES